MKETPSEETGRRWPFASRGKAALGRNQPCQHLNLGLPDSRTTRKQISAESQLPGLCLAALASPGGGFPLTLAALE